MSLQIRCEIIKRSVKKGPNRAIFKLSFSVYALNHSPPPLKVNEGNPQLVIVELQNPYPITVFDIFTIFILNTFSPGPTKYPYLRPFFAYPLARDTIHW